MDAYFIGKMISPIEIVSFVVILDTYKRKVGRVTERRRYFLRRCTIFQ
jgi:hypothetical protein